MRRFGAHKPWRPAAEVNLSVRRFGAHKPWRPAVEVNLSVRRFGAHKPWRPAVEVNLSVRRFGAHCNQSTKSMIPSDHFVRFYNEVFKFLDERGGLQAYYKVISRHQEIHCLELFKAKGLRGVIEYYEKIRKEENCNLRFEIHDDYIISNMIVCPSLSKVLDCDATPCQKYCDHCAGWSKPLYTKCGIYYVQNMKGRDLPSCVSVRTESREIAQRFRQKFLDEGIPPELVNSNLDDWQEVEKNKASRVKAITH